MFTLVISPHLDDAVFGCGQWLASHPGCTVATVFAGTPASNELLTDWDERSGFQNAAQAIAVRRREDQLALEVLKARPLWLGFPDHQYGQAVSVQSIAQALEKLLEENGVSQCLLPVGLFHSDHLLASDAALLAWQRHSHIEVLAYEDALYRCMPGLLQQKLMSLAQNGLVATPLSMAPDPDAAALKLTAIEQYASQIKAFGSDGMDDLMHPERFWQLQEIQA